MQVMNATVANLTFPNVKVAGERLYQYTASEISEITSAAFRDGIAIGISIGLLVAAAFLFVYFIVQKRNPEEKKKNRLSKRSPW